MNNKESKEAGQAAGGGSCQVLTFSLGSETYGVDILRVKEIRGWSPVTRIPHSPACVLGVLNLRGAVVPIIDLRIRFALPKAEFTTATVIIVLSLHTAQGQRECGVVADSVRDVADLALDKIQPVPAMYAGTANEFIKGITTVDDQMLILLDPDDLVARALAPTEISNEAA